MPQGSYKKSKCDVSKQKEKHKRKSAGLKKGGNAFVFKNLYYRSTSINQSNFIMKCDKRTQNIESSVRMTVQKNIKKQNT